MMNLFLYGTSACHLCEQAKDIIWLLLEEYPLRLLEIDIAESDELLERYGVRIPVVKFPDKEKELQWPFDQFQMRAFLAEGMTAA